MPDRYDDPDLVTPHYQRVRAFIKKMNHTNQPAPSTPAVPSQEVRQLRVKLAFEEFMELAAGLGVEVLANGRPLEHYEVTYRDTGAFDWQQVIDGCADVSVINTGTLIACGVPDKKVLEIVDEANLAKFGPGHSFRDDGKLLKPADWVPPAEKLQAFLLSLSY